MKRGDVWWVNVGSPAGDEIQKPRPGVIVSNDASNKYLNRVQVVPLTSSVEHLYPSEASVMVKGKKNKAMSDPSTTVSKIRSLSLVGRLSTADLKGVEGAVRVQWGLTPRPPMASRGASAEDEQRYSRPTHFPEWSPGGRPGDRGDPTQFSPPECGQPHADLFASIR